jgi:hypothetical protein
METQELNNPKNNLDRDELHYDVWEVFDDPVDPDECEILLARIFLDTLKIDLEGEYLIQFRAEPQHLANMFVHFIRTLKTEYPGLMSDDGCNKIIHGGSWEL